MDYADSIKYLESFQRFGIRLGLNRVRAVMSKMGDPQGNFQSIHIAGTNGKGSVAAMLSSILNKAGYKVGLYTSPHLVDYTERIRINEKDVSRKRFARAVSDVRKALKKCPGIKLTEFEVLTAGAFLLFSQEKIDIAVIEVGLGGRLDATNIIDPTLTIITNIAHDHMDVLGGEIRRIAMEKAGIIKSFVPLVTGEKSQLGILKSICRKMGSKLIKTGKIRIGSAPLKGDHQIENTMIVLTAVKTLNGLGFKATSKDIKDGLRSTRWPGRMQVLKTSPLMILDGAHNPAGAKALCRHLRTYGKKFAIVVGMQSNKDIEKYLEEIDPVASDYIAVRSGNKNAADAKRVAKIAEKFRKNVLVASNLEHAEILAKSLKKPICVTGSLYLIGDIMRQKLFDL